MKTKELPRFPTIREEARFGNTLSEHELRLMLKRGELPGFYYGESQKYFKIDRKSTRLNSSHIATSRMPSSA